MKRNAAGTAKSWAASVALVLVTLGGSRHAHAADARALIDEARQDSNAGQLEPAKALLIQALSQLDTGRKKSADYGEAAMLLGTTLERLGDRSAAEGRYRDAVAAWSASLGADHPNSAGAMAALASVLEAQGEVREALPLRKRVLATALAVFGPSHALTGTSWHNYARAQLLSGDLSGAQASFERALSVREAALGPNHPDVAQSLAGVGSVYRQLGQMDRAAEYAERALRILQQQAHPDPSTVALAFEHLGAVALDRAEYAKAEEYFERAMGMYRAANGAESVQVGLAANNLSEVFVAMGRYRDAEEGFRAALSILSRAQGDAHPDVALVRTNLANLLLLQGNFPAAEAVVTPAIATYERVNGPKHPSLSKPLRVLAKVRALKQEHAAAEALLLRVRDIEAAVSTTSGNYASALSSLAAHYDAVDQPDKALDYDRRALAIYEHAYGPRHPSVATLHAAIASQLVYQGKLKEAESEVQAALDIERQLLGADHPDVAQDLLNMAGIRAALGQFDLATLALAEAGQIREKFLSAQLASGSDSQRRAVYASLYGETNYALSLHLETRPGDSRLADLAYETLLRRKGRLLDQLAGDRAVLSSHDDAATHALLDQVSEKRAKLAGYLLGGARGADALATETRLRADLLGLERSLSEKSEAFRSASTPATRRDVARALPPHTALVEYVKYYPFRIDAKKASQRWGKPAYAAYVVRPDGGLGFVKLGPSEAIDHAVLAFRRKIQDKTLPDPRPEARAVALLVFDPVEKELGGAHELFLSTDGALATLPFAALTGTHGEYLVERYLFSFVGSGRDLLRFAAPSLASSAPFVLTNPDYDLSGAAPAQPAKAEGERSLSLTDELFTPLPGTALEGKAVAATLNDAQTVSGKDATTSALTRLHGPSVLHIATHGFYVPQSKGPVPDAQSELLRAVLPRVDDPFVRSGLALAGANSRGAADDGILSAYEALNLDLHGTRLVTLSACETGLGELIDGIEVQGLGRAFTIAGAETLLTSLWKVSDDATRDLMASYYERLAKGGGRAESLRDVQRDFIARADRATPYYWAAFSVSGNPAALSGTRVAADVDTTSGSVPQVSPGSRGCGCRTAHAPSTLGEDAVMSGVLLACALVVLRRKRRSLTRLLPSLLALALLLAPHLALAQPKVEVSKDLPAAERERLQLAVDAMVKDRAKKDYKAAQKKLSKGIALCKAAHCPADDQARYEFYLGIVLAEGGDEKAAQASFESALKVNPTLDASGDLSSPPVDRAYSAARANLPAPATPPAPPAPAVVQASASPTDAGFNQPSAQADTTAALSAVGGATYAPGLGFVQGSDATPGTLSVDTKPKQLSVPSLDQSTVWDDRQFRYNVGLAYADYKFNTNTAGQKKLGGMLLDIRLGEALPLWQIVIPHLEIGVSAGKFGESPLLLLISGGNYELWNFNGDARVGLDINADWFELGAVGGGFVSYYIPSLENLPGEPSVSGRDSGLLYGGRARLGHDVFLELSYTWRDGQYTTGRNRRIEFGSADDEGGGWSFYWEARERPKDSQLAPSGASQAERLIGGMPLNWSLGFCLRNY